MGIRVGIGGWTYAPWRGVFYPEGLPHARELEFASRAVTAIEINATYHRLQSPSSFARWAEQTPAGFVFSVKASRVCTNRRNLGDGAEAVERFFAQGLTELGEKLGPIVWQLMETKRFDAGEIAAFFALLPPSRDGISLRHAIEVRHETFCDPAFVAMARDANVAIVYNDDPQRPQIADCTAGFVYARLHRTREDEPDGYTGAELQAWARAARRWSNGESPPGLPYLEPKKARATARDVFVFMIDGAKVRAPAAAQRLLQVLKGAAR